MSFVTRKMNFGLIKSKLSVGTLKIMECYGVSQVIFVMFMLYICNACLCCLKEKWNISARLYTVFHVSLSYKWPSDMYS